jgi:hypothetical protein
VAGEARGRRVRGAPLARLAVTKRVRVVVDLTEVDHALLTASVQHTGQTEAEIIGEALRCYFVHYPRPTEERE